MEHISSKVSILSALLMTSTALHATEFEFNISNDAVGAKLEASQRENTFNYSARILVSEDDGYLLSGSVFSTGKLQAANNIYGGFGVRGYHVDPDTDSFQAIAVGGFIDILLPVEGLSVDAEIYLAPSLTINGDYDGFSEIFVRAKYQIFENARVFAGLRDIEADFEGGGELTIIDGLYLGFEIDM